MELSGLFANPGPTSCIQVIRPIVKSLDKPQPRPQVHSAPPKVRRKVHLTTAQMQGLVASYLCGSTTVELAGKYGIHHTTV